ncbi:MAG: fumarylacetoacetate hydrolase family protein [Flavobacteriaceae bacterium]
MILYNTKAGPVIEQSGVYYDYLRTDFENLLLEEELFKKLTSELTDLKKNTHFSLHNNASLLPPIGSQEVWAAGVTYYKSRTARMEESASSGGSDFYDRVYEADRPELFFKSNGYRVKGHEQNVRIRKDSQWSVPEPELTLVLHPTQKILGYTIGNDMSSRSIEGENPLYLPQAKSYRGATALGPGILVTDQPLSDQTNISITINRKGTLVFEGSTSKENLKRSFKDLISYLFMELDFPHGCFLMTGTGIVPEAGFTLEEKDSISITIAGIGTLTNTVHS